MKAIARYPSFLIWLLLAAVYAAPAWGQSPTTTLKGRVVDADNRQPVPLATVIIVGSSPLVGQITDEDGYFKLTEVALGRVTIRVSSLGYEDRVVPNIVLISGKEFYAEVELKEAFTTLAEVVVKPETDRGGVQNEMALVSSRSLSIEAAERYAGGIGDPARLVSSFAGVAGTGDGNNDIIVRGNNPRFVQWRLEGIEIPNPNHFSGEGLTGGPISVLNSRMLANSSFYTGAFPAAYGNVLSSVFDVDFRNGNTDKREHSFSVGALGIDFTTEGPIDRQRRSSYLVNYRYSTLGLLDQLGVVDFGGVPQYQDAAFKVQVPTGKLGTIFLFGMGGDSRIDTEYREFEDSEQVTSRYSQRSRVGIVGVKQVIATGKDAYLKTVVSYSGNGSTTGGMRVFDTPTLEEDSDARLANTALRISSTIHHKLGARHLLTAGVVGSFFYFDFASKRFDVAADEFRVGQDITGTASLMQGFTSWKWRIAEHLSLVSGLHLEKTSLNREISLEPRASLRYDFTDRQAVTAAFGVHGNMTSLSNYFAVVYEEGQPIQPNTTLKLLKARHFVVGYENRLSDQLRLKVEAYYQSLYDIGVETGESSYSLINQQADYSDRRLESTGLGRNYGIDLTLEKYFSSNYYFLVTGSLYQARYRGSDAVWRNARFNGNYLANVLVGKEFPVGKARNNTWAVNGKFNLLGARYLMAIDLDRSIANGSAVYDEAHAFTDRGENVISLNLATSYQVNREKVSHSFKLDVQNVTGNEAVIDYYYNTVNQQIEEGTQLSLLPVLSYTLNF
ncbi:carboxypeptidase-like protein [Neolewinella xylanilytica]|uniref:Carboxypeptidase-like protein n=1 Tax=Neolewinella xylanilytica TaxID=1514080 RepID=A0A2S6I7D9_9BACT|nr:TonB-dependent receptor [Neolewinella xylanilytica]PPK87397.1 carboxypeptidase-like protein [Neolewinella xylanilytica]